MADKREAKIPVTIGICAYNEERNIGELLSSLLRQKTRISGILEILVVASGCADRTPEIVESLAVNDGRIRLILQEEREGKASAINEILREARGEVIVLESADTIPHEESIERLTRPFVESSVGVVASRPVPGDGLNTFWGAIAYALWEMHHEVSKQVPKTGEMFAFRKVVDSIPDGVGADEDWIRYLVEMEGYQVLYQPSAIVYNAGPKTLDEFLRQRIRCDIQELYQRRESSFVTPTWRTPVVVNAILGYLRGGKARLWPFISLFVLELMARAYSLIRIALKPQDLSVWDELPSTKSVKAVDEAKAEGK